MSFCLTVFDAEQDPLWLRGLGGVWGDGTKKKMQTSAPLIVNLDRQERTAIGNTLDDQPHNANVIAWRRCFESHRLSRLDLYGPSRRSLGLLAGATLAKLDINIHVTCSVMAGTSTLIRGIARCSRAIFTCPAEFIAQQLYRLGIERTRVMVRPPVLPTRLTSAERCQEIRRRVAGGDNICVLALAHSHNFPALQSTIWSAALAKYAYGQMTLVVAGACTAKERDRLVREQQKYHAKDLIYLDDGQSDWEELVGAGDVVLAAGAPFNEVIRFLQARASGRPVVAAAYPFGKLLDDYDNGHVVNSTAPGQLAAAILGLLDTVTIS